MAIEHLQSNHTETDSALEDNRPPADAAPVKSKLPVDGGDNPENQGNSGESWDDINKKLAKETNVDVEADKLSEVEELKLKLKIEQERVATEEKRRKDAQRAFKEKAEELKRLREEAEAKSKKIEDTQKLKDDMASGDIAAPESDDDWDKFAEEYGLTEEEREIFELNPEMRTGLEKILLKRLDSGLSEREQKAKESEMKAIEQQMEEDQRREWMSRVKKVYPDADKTIENQEFQVWLQANEGLRAGILSNKEEYDPSGLVEILDHYNDYLDKRKTIQERRSFGRQSSVSHPSMSAPSSSIDDDMSWKALNAKLERERSR